jgi:hypothetical protein
MFETIGKFKDGDMTREDYNEFLCKLDRYYPSFKRWLQESSDDWKAIIWDYFECFRVESVTLDEAIEVLNGWNTGRIEGAPIGFENQRFLANFLTAVRQKRVEHNAQKSRNTFSIDILGDCEDLPIRSKVPNKGPLVGRMVTEFHRLRELNLSKGVASA